MEVEDIYSSGVNYFLLDSYLTTGYLTRQAHFFFFLLPGIPILVALGYLNGHREDPLLTR